jgi:hypothetical protein
MSKSAEQPKKGTPRTGDGRKGGPKPKREDLRMLRKDGKISYEQPEGWTGKVIRLFRG